MSGRDEAEDGIRDKLVTGVQTCALPISYANDHKNEIANHVAALEADAGAGRPMGFYAAGKPEILTLLQPLATILQTQGAGVTRLVDETGRSEERRVGKECRCRGGTKQKTAYEIS